MAVAKRFTVFIQYINLNNNNNNNSMTILNGREKVHFLNQLWSFGFEWMYFAKNLMSILECKNA